MTMALQQLAAPDSVLRYEVVNEHTALLTLNRPEARNAVSAELAHLMEKVVSATEVDQRVRAVVLSSSHPDVFCAGADLKEVHAGRGDQLFTEKNGFAGLVYAQRSKPWIAAVNGKALAGGCELVLACDMVVASARAEFGLPEVLRGLVAAAGGMYRLPRVLPPNIAMEMIATALPLGGERAYALGMVNRLVDSHRVLEEALLLADQIAENAPLAVRESLKVARTAFAQDESNLRSITREARSTVAASNDFKEGPLAFIEKRKPCWTGT
ncbi:MAG: enoyl-CoA hydratase/isomerase family protein [Comamonadaceae bacterium]|nr:enoyl-CoA hydratase/isomerase family protein [Comamonadaceae bacterium]